MSLLKVKERQNPQLEKCCCGMWFEYSKIGGMSEAEGDGIYVGSVTWCARHGIFWQLEQLFQSSVV